MNKKLLTYGLIGVIGYFAWKKLFKKAEPIVAPEPAKEGEGDVAKADSTQSAFSGQQRYWR